MREQRRNSDPCWKVNCSIADGRQPSLESPGAPSFACIPDMAKEDVE